jgi:hypothetical protein
MKKLVYFVVSILFLAVLTSCSNAANHSDDQPKMLYVELSTKPETGKVNQPLTFEAKVTQGNEKVNDADEVLFEIWRSKDVKHEQITVTHPKNGIYRLEKSFQQEGTYYIVSHVTARGMHNMPKKEFIVGTPSEPEDSNSKNSMNRMNMDDKKAHEKDNLKEGH